MTWESQSMTIESAVLIAWKCNTVADAERTARRFGDRRTLAIVGSAEGARCSVLLRSGKQLTEAES
jgi:hypothetical protein